MRIDGDLCVQCELCVPYCPVRAIRVEGPEVVIDQDECVECEICQKANVCVTDALVMDPLEWPRSLRNVFSNPLLTHKDTNVPGRGTEEIKTNDVTGRFKVGRAGVAIELGRPGTGSRFVEVEKIAMACAEFNVNFEPQNPVTVLMVDKSTGKMKDEVLQEKVLSAIVEFELAAEKVPALMKRLQEVTKELTTVCSVGYIYRVDPKGEFVALDYLEQAGLRATPNGKHNVGLGRPLAKEA